MLLTISSFLFSYCFFFMKFVFLQFFSFCSTALFVPLFLSPLSNTVHIKVDNSDRKYFEEKTALFQIQVTESWESEMTRNDSLSNEFQESDGAKRWIAWVRKWLQSTDAENRPKWLTGVDSDISDEQILQLPAMQRLRDSWEKVELFFYSYVLSFRFSL